MIEKIHYGGWANNVRLSNGVIELVVTLDVGPRIIRFANVGESNIFTEFSSEIGKSGETGWRIRGGHRFWHAPEAIPRTYVVDNHPVPCEPIDEFRLCVMPAPETENGIQKQIDIAMDPGKNTVTLIHRIANIGRWNIELAPWALSVMAPGGQAILPLPPKRPHTERPNPAYSLTFWSYTDLTDPRLTLGQRYILLNHAMAQDPCKWGMNIDEGWAAYRVNETLFLKTFNYQAAAIYPDNGCNFETYSDGKIMELETLGPLTTLVPGQGLTHTETWWIFSNIPSITGEADVDRIVRPLINEIL